jgi:hypothetical protein
VDLINLYCNFCRSEHYPKPVIGSTAQMSLVLTASVLMGAIFGIVFGTMDVEDSSHVHAALRSEQSRCAPIGAAIGAFVGAMNQWILQHEERRFIELATSNEGTIMPI